MVALMFQMIIMKSVKLGNEISQRDNWFRGLGFGLGLGWGCGLGWQFGLLIIWIGTNYRLDFLAYNLNIFRWCCNDSNDNGVFRKGFTYVVYFLYMLACDPFELLSGLSTSCFPYFSPCLGGRHVKKNLNLGFEFRFYINLYIAIGYM